MHARVKNLEVVAVREVVRQNVRVALVARRAGHANVGRAPIGQLSNEVLGEGGHELRVVVHAIPG